MPDNQGLVDGDLVYLKEILKETGLAFNNDILEFAWGKICRKEYSVEWVCPESVPTKCIIELFVKYLH